MSGIGPVEGPVEDPVTGPAGPGADSGPVPARGTLSVREYLTADSRPPAGYWDGLTTRGRRTAKAAIAALAAAAVIGLGHAMRTAEPLPDPGPWPAQSTYIAYATGQSASGALAGSGVFGFNVTVRNGTPLTILRVTPSFEGLTAEIDPSAPFTVNPGTTRHITIKMIVHKCAGLPLDADLPFLDVTLRNARAIQNQSFIFGGACPRDLSAFLHEACRQTAATSSSIPWRKCGFSACGRGHKAPKPLSRPQRKLKSFRRA
ncbi:hypothetical protein QMK19_08125 [Streptomyces sp. H10-C2]|uniref:hypothetical protein n=1 Tax=unclassified Streptomyces TaxID=2593676 RepID=UPI0024B8A840|nr:MULTISPECIES: hypothetical protein [unclassified Streptomyces]MDJ0344481.1 hypothetical protein [Streptomyces sp. PH10-H1]MDJ0369645.1 hypothetical protein [Streptomyces sp. H10-C2]